MELKTLEILLSDNGIDVSAFGQGEAKTLEHLLYEIKTGEAILEVQNGQLVRKLNVLNIDVWHTTLDGLCLRLVEDRQEFADGRKRHRSLPTAISEKWLAHEVQNKAIARALKEELGVVTFNIHNRPETLLSKKIESPSFPGLTSEYCITKCSVVIDSSEFKPEGYIEHQKDKNTYFVWVVSKNRP